MRFSDFLLVSNPTDLDFIVGYTDEQNIRINVLDLFAGQIIGTGNPGYLPVFTGSNIIGDSALFQDGSNLVIGGEDSLGYKLAIAGSLLALDGAVIESLTPGSNTFRAIGEEGDSFIIPSDSDESIWTSRRIMHADAVLVTESTTLGQLNTAISTLEGDIDILLDLKVDKISIGAPNGVASLDSGGKIPLSEIPDSIIGQVEYMGTWDALTNTPYLNPLVPEEKGHYYVVSVAGVFNGIDYQVGDWIISNGVEWQKVDNTDAVTSVFGRIGAILALESDYQAFYPRLSQAYDNPSWINSLSFLKLTDVPPFLLENQTITLSGDVTGSGKTSIVSTISDNVVTDLKLRDSLGTSVIGRASSTTGDPADIQASADGQVLQRSGGALLFGLISSDSIASIDWSKIINTPTTLAGYGITDAYTKTESDNKFVPYIGANANVNLGSNNITANAFVKAGGTPSQFLKADGSVDVSQYVPTTRSINAGTGLTGGGNLSSDVTLSFDTTWGDNRYAYRTRQLTINGITYDLSADRTWVVGTVNTLTTIGTSGPATLVGDTLNIPNYTTDLTGYVPYIGATQDVNLGNHGITLDTVLFNDLPSGTVLPRQLRWNPDRQTLDLGMGVGGSVQQIGMETYYPLCKNQTGSTIPDGTFVMAVGTLGASGRILIAPAVTDGSIPARFMLGVTTHDILNGEDGLVTWFGEIRGFDTVAKAPVGEIWVDGTVLWANPAVPGGFTSVEPSAPNLKIAVAQVLYAATNGVIVVRPSLGSRLTDLHDVDAFSPNNKDLISYNTAVGHWDSVSLGSVIGGISSQFVKGDGSLDSTVYVTVNTNQSITGYKSFENGLSLASDGGTNQITKIVNIGSIHEGSAGLNQIGFNNSNNIYFGKGLNNGGVIQWNNSSARYYTLQDGDGTLAFLSDIPSLAGYVTLATDQTITGLKTILRGGDVLNFKIGTDTLYGLKVAYNQNELVPSGEATWSFVSTFNNGSGTGLETTPISFFRGVLVTGERLLSVSVNSNLLDYYVNNPSGRYPIYAYNTGVQQFASSIIVGETTGVVNAVTGAIADLPSGVVANFKGRVIGSDAVNNNEFVTLSQATSVSRASISLTTTGTSGPATYDNITGVLNIPEYQGGVTSFNGRTGAVTLTSGDVTTALGYTPVTDARTLTINGVGYDLTADRSWTVGVNPSAREIQTFTATASQTTFTVSGGYTVGLVDVFINGVRLTSSDYTATNGTTVVLTVGTSAGNIVDIIKYTSGFTNAVSGTGTTNYLPKFTGSTTIGNSNLINDASGNLGLGVTPSADIWTSFKGIQINAWAGGIFSGSGVTNFVHNNYFDGTNVKYFRNGSAGTYQINGNSHIWFTAPSGTAGNTISFTQAMTLFSTGNLLVGTTTDNGARLQVTGASGNITGVGVNYVNNTDDAFALVINNAGSSAQNDRGVFEARVSGNSVFRINNSGNVGIGTTSPTEKLYIEGSTPYIVLANTEETESGITFIDTASAAQSAKITFNSGTGNNLNFYNNAASVRMSITPSGNVGIGTTSPNSYYSSKLVVAVGDEDGITIAGVNDNYLMFADGTSGEDRYRGYIQYSHTADYMALATNAAERLRITSSGNVLIGTTTDNGAKLQVSGVGQFTDTIRTTNGTINMIMSYSTAGVIGTQSNHDLQIRTNNTAKLTITSTGNVGIGTTAPDKPLVLRAAAPEFKIISTAAQTGGTAYSLVSGSNSGSLFISADPEAASTTSPFMSLQVFGAERMRITSGGQLQVGGTVQSFNARMVIHRDAYSIESRSTGTSSEGHVVFRNGNGAVGTIFTNGSSTSYNTSSDYRLKTDLKDYNGLDLVSKIKTYDFEWKTEKSRSFGVIAHELQDVINYAVTGQKDGIEMQGVDYSKLVPIMVKAIQELKQEIDTLKNQ